MKTHRTTLLLVILVMAVSLFGRGLRSYTLKQEPSDKAMGSTNLPLSFEEMASAYAQVVDYTCVFKKAEFIDKEMNHQQMEMLFKEPFNVKFVWIKPHKGQKAVYMQGQNENRVRARKGGFLGMFAVNLDPLDKRAMNENRHPITEAGIGYLIQMTLKDLAKGSYELRYIGDESVEGRDCYHYLFESKGERDLHYGLRTEFWIDKELKLPIQSKHFDYDNRWIETYTYSELKLNVGLTEDDFKI